MITGLADRPLLFDPLVGLAEADFTLIRRWLATR